MTADPWAPGVRAIDIPVGANSDTHIIEGTFLKDETGAVARPFRMTAQQLAEHIRLLSAPSKAELRWLKLAILGDKRSPRNSLRWNGNVQWITGIEGEHDDGTMTFDEAVTALRAANIRSIVYTSPSHVPVTGERWRVLAPLSERHPSETRAGFVARLNGILQGKLTGESFTLSQAFYYGSVDNSPDHRVEVIDGDFLNRRDDTYAGSIFKDGSKVGDNATNGKAGRNGSQPHAPRETDDHEPAELSRIEFALATFSSQCGYFEWLYVAAGLFHELGEDGYALFHDWSSKATGLAKDGTEMFTTAKCQERWNGARTMTDRRIGTLFRYADQADPTWRQRYEDEMRERAFAEMAGSTGPARPAAGNNANPTPAVPADTPLPESTLDEVHACFEKWFGPDYDLDAINGVLAAAAAEQLDGDPPWLLLISGAGNAKTETVQALAGAGAHVTSTIASEGALLSGAVARGKAAKLAATGGLLRKIGPRGILVIKDVTSILSANRDTRATVLAAIREIYDGRWERNLGVEGGITLTWQGRIIVIGAVTTAWDTAHSVIAACGDRFVLLRMDSRQGRLEAGAQAIRNTGSEVEMRQELAEAAGGLLSHIDTDAEYALDDAERHKLLKAANVVTYARTAVERDYQGEVIEAHAPEMPTRFAKQLTQMARGALAIGLDRAKAMALALRCAKDSIPPLRFEILLDCAKHPRSRPGDVRKRVNRPWRTVKREMEGLHMLGLLDCSEEPGDTFDEKSNEPKTVWRYSLGLDFDVDTLVAMDKGFSAWVEATKQTEATSPIKATKPAFKNWTTRF